MAFVNDTAQNNYVEIFDTASGQISTASAGLYPALDMGLAAVCLISLPESDAFVVTGGEKLVLST